MTKVVCATRGGVGSRTVQRAAIERARTTKGELVFLYVIDLTSLGGHEEGLASSVREELRWMGQTILRIAEKRAEDSGMAAERVIREGKVGEEIARYLTESGATLLLLGAPRKEDLSRFGEDGIVRFAEWIQAATGVAVEVVRSRNAAA